MVSQRETAHNHARGKRSIPPELRETSCEIFSLVGPTVFLRLAVSSVTTYAIAQSCKLDSAPNGSLLRWGLFAPSTRFYDTAPESLN